jgi:DNA-binding LacI/PurR family transcriptional regulator
MIESSYPTLRVPEDIALVGFDDLPQSMVTFPFLTVASQPASEIGRQSVALLLARIADPTRPPREVNLPTELIVRRSSGGPLEGYPASRPSPT